MAGKGTVLVCDGDGYGDCGEPALYVRHTQFAGSHPFCMLHALAERDFMQSDSYQFWEKLGPGTETNQQTDDGKKDRC
jgi:hypothetical protein